MQNHSLVGRFGKPALRCGLAGLLILAGCGQPSNLPPAKPTTATAPPLPVATGFEIATLRVTPPRGNEGHPLVATLKHEGRTVGRGITKVAETGATEIVIRALNKSIELKNGLYDLWLVNDRDGMVASHPGFGDLYLRDTWQWPKVAKVMVYDDMTQWKFKRLGRAEDLITIHYHRNDDDYDDVGIWSWDETKQKTPEPNELLEVGRNAFGLIFQFDRSEYGSDKIGLVSQLHADWS